MDIRHFTYQFQEAGSYEVRVTWKNAPRFTPTKVLVTVKESPGDYTDLTNTVERGEISMRPLSIEEKRWIKDYTKDYEDKTELNNLDNYMIAEVHDILSHYAYNLGPRASSAIHREGLRRDFNDVFEWYPATGSGSAVFLTSPAFIKEAKGFLSTNMNTALWPESWDKTWLYHNPNKGNTAPQTDKVEVLRDGGITALTSFNSTMDEAFTKLNSAQNTLPWMRWFPWIAISPTNGYKFNRYIKTAMDVNKFVTNENEHDSGLGLFSGKPKTKLLEVSNAIEDLNWFDYGSPQGSKVSATEMNRHLSDDKKNLMDFYNDLYYGRKIIFKPGANSFPMVGQRIVVKNVNPKLYGSDSSKPEKIYIAGAIIKGPPSMPTPLAGIPLLTLDGARKDRNDLNGSYIVEGGTASIAYKNDNACLKIVSNDWNNKPIRLEVNIPSQLTNPIGEGTTRVAKTPIIIGHNVSLGRGGTSDLNVKVSAFNNNGTLTQNPNCTVQGSGLVPFEFNDDISNPPSKILIEINKEDNPAITSPPEIYVDNIYLTISNFTDSKVTEPFTPPTAENAFLKWLAESSYRFFDWNYKELTLYNDTKAVFLESAQEIYIKDKDNKDVKNPECKVSLGGQGMGIATTLLAEKAGYITPETAKNRITNVLKWLKMIQNQSIGSGSLPNARVGWHGMPSHYFNPDGNVYNPKVGESPAIEVSTIDWAICAQGIRLARQYYWTDEYINQLTSDLLLSVEWSKFVIPTGRKEADGKPFHNEGRIAFTLESNGNIKFDHAWGEAFSEETELVYLEVLASDYEKYSLSDMENTGDATQPPITFSIDINKEIYRDANNIPVKVIHRECKNGFIPSYFGSGFTYNWLQLWYGSRELSSYSYNNWGWWGTTKYYYNSQKAYQADYDTAISRFGYPYMGLTAVSTISSIAPNGFVTYNNYLGKQGSDKNLAPEGQVVQVAPAPYGAALALPFEKDKAMTALRAYANLGFRHEYMGLPESLVLQGTGNLGTLPNWTQMDINMAPIAMAIDQMGDNKYIANILVKDKYAMYALYDLYTSFNSDYNACPAAMGSGKVDTGGKLMEIGPMTEEEALLQDNILLYPNPNTGDFTLRFSIHKPGVYEGAFMDLQGRVIRHDRWEFSNVGSHDVAFRGLRQKGLSPGLYLMVVKGNGMEKTIKVLVRN